MRWERVRKRIEQGGERAGALAWSATKAALRLTATALRALARLPGLRHGLATLRQWLAPVLETTERYIDVARIAYAEQQKTQPTNIPSPKARTFLPAVLEIQETPPSPLGRATAWTLMTLFTLAILWSLFGKIDIIAVARGKIIPSDYSKTLQAPEGGVIKGIHVRNGQAVKAGDLLIELDPTFTTADQERASNEHLAAELEAARLKALLAGRSTLIAPDGADPAFVKLQTHMLREQLAEHRAKRDAARLLAEQRQAALEVTKVNITRLEKTVPMLNQRADAYKKLAEEKFLAQTQYLEIESERVDKVQELAALRHKLVQDQAALAEATQSLHALDAAFKREHQAQLAALETRSASLSQEVIKADQRTRFHTLTAPIDGVVQQLAVHTLGGVVTPAQQLLVIVPKNHQLEVEAWVENKDIGFVAEGQAVQVKIDTFPFTRYGTIDGKVLHVTSDAVPNEKEGLLFVARIALDQWQIQVEDKTIHLSPGMNITAEIKTGQRRLIEYFLSPLLQYKQESIRER